MTIALDLLATGRVLLAILFSTALLLAAGYTQRKEMEIVNTICILLILVFIVLGANHIAHEILGV